MPNSILCTSGLAGPWIGMPGTRMPFTVPPAATSRRHCPSDFEPPAQMGMRGSGGFPGPVLAISDQPARWLVVSIALLGEEDAHRVDAAEVQAQEPRPLGRDGDARDLVAGLGGGAPDEGRGGGGGGGGGERGARGGGR